jgi:deoxyribodipyrimidine photolyase-related protein
MSDYCRGCRYRPDLRHGDDACPMTTLYWHFLQTQQAELANNPRAGTMLLSLKRLPDEEKRAINAHAATILSRLDSL